MTRTPCALFVRHLSRVLEAIMMLSMDRALFLQHIYRHWAERFGSQATVITQRGTTVLRQRPRADQYPIQLWSIGDHAFLSLHPLAAPFVALAHWSPTQTLSLPDLLALIHPHCTFTHSTRQLAYLYPPDLPPVQPCAPLVLRPLTRRDASALHTLRGQ